MIAAGSCYVHLVGGGMGADAGAELEELHAMGLVEREGLGRGSSQTTWCTSCSYSSQRAHYPLAVSRSVVYRKLVSFHQCTSNLAVGWA